MQYFSLFWTPDVNATHLQELAGCLRPGLSPDDQNRKKKKNRSRIQTNIWPWYYNLITQALNMLVVGLYKPVENFDGWGETLIFLIKEGNHKKGRGTKFWNFSRESERGGAQFLTQI